MRTAAMACDTRRGAWEEPVSLHHGVVLFRVGNVSVATFGLLAALGVTAGAWVACVRQIQAGMAPSRYAPVLFLVLPTLSIVGSRLFALGLDWHRVRHLSWARHGFAFQGGFILTVAGVAALAAVYHLELLLLMDTFVLGVPLGHSLGRIGCFTYGCCHGRPTRSPLCVRYTNPESKAVWQSGLAGVPLYPTQVYSAVGNLVLFCLLGVLATRQRCPGELAGIYLTLSSVGRFGIEFLRGVPVRRWLGWSPFQWIAVILFGVGVALWIHASTGTERLLFARGDGLVEALRSSGDLAGYMLLLFLGCFAVFGLHGPRVGRR